MSRIAAAVALITLLAGGVLLAGGTSTTQAQEDVEAGSVERGANLYEANCATCHGRQGKGVGDWPAIADAGEAATDFQLRTGRMPFAQELGEQAQRKPPAYEEQEIRDLAAFVGSLGNGPEIPEVTLDDALLSEGQQLFAVNCAPCHGASGNGGALGGGAIAWPLTEAPPLIVAEAMITGPGQMPVFELPQDQLNAVVTYVEYLRHAPTPGGFSIGGIGPVPEGFVAWLVGLGALVLIVYLIGREWDRKGSADDG